MRHHRCMDARRSALIADLGDWRTDIALALDGTDPILPTPWPVGEVAAVALAQLGAAGAALARRAGAELGPVRVSVADAAAATIGFAVMRVDGESLGRTNAGNPWVDRYRCADGRWIHLHGGFPPLVDRLASLLGMPPAPTSIRSQPRRRSGSRQNSRTRLQQCMGAQRSFAPRTSGASTRRVASSSTCQRSSRASATQP